MLLWRSDVRRHRSAIWWQWLLSIVRSISFDGRPTESESTFNDSNHFRKKIRKKSSIFWWRSRWRHHTTDIYCEYVYNQFREWRVDEWGGCIRFRNWRLAMNECMHIAQKSEEESKIVDMRNHDAICSIHMHLYLVKYERRPLRRVVALKRQFMQCTCNFIATNRECIETWDTVFFPFYIFLRSLILFFFNFIFSLYWLLWRHRQCKGSSMVCIHHAHSSGGWSHYFPAIRYFFFVIFNYTACASWIRASGTLHAIKKNHTTWNRWIYYTA